MNNNSYSAPVGRHERNLPRVPPDHNPPSLPARLERQIHRPPFLQLHTKDECKKAWYSIGTPKAPFQGDQDLSPIHDQQFEAFVTQLWVELDKSVVREWWLYTWEFAWDLLFVEFEGLVEQVAEGRIPNRRDFCQSIGDLDFEAIRADWVAAKRGAQFFLQLIELEREPLKNVIKALNTIHGAVVAKLNREYGLARDDRMSIQHAYNRFRDVTAHYLVVVWRLRGVEQVEALEKAVKQIEGRLPENLTLERARAIFDTSPEEIRQATNKLLEPEHRLQYSMPTSPTGHVQLPGLREHLAGVEGVPPIGSQHVERSLESAPLSSRRRQIYGIA